MYNYREIAAYFYFMDIEIKEVPQEYSFLPYEDEDGVSPENTQSFINASITQTYNDPNMIDPIDNEEYFLRANNFISAMEIMADKIRRFTSTNTEEEIMFEFYEVGKKFYGEDKKQLRNFFRDIYIILFGKAQGSRLGALVKMFGYDEFLDKMHRNMSNPFMIGI